ncbi:protein MICRORCHIDIA 7 isoform X2 [Physcomitrium patens]|uniref:protein MICRORCHIDIA 7 isoform X2 n=1 Tax=Physcomitrium patens TaxID=3218 RepID=UPI003CCCBC3D
MSIIEGAQYLRDSWWMELALPPGAFASNNSSLLSKGVFCDLLSGNGIQGAAMSALGEVTKEEEADEIYELSSSSTNSDDLREEEELVKRVSPQGSPWSEGFSHKKQKVEPVNVLRLNSWRYEDLKNEALGDLGLDHEAKVDSLVALPFFPQPSPDESARKQTESRAACKQFWKAGDYDGQPAIVMQQAGAIDHVRVHPKFLHSNATSHRWVLGAVAELVDNAVDEVMNGATFVNVDVSLHPRNRSPMLVIQDDGGGMTPDRMRQCMSLGYSSKSKSDNSIGQYGNGFKTSTMRLAADVIVFSRSRASNGHRATQSIGMLSFTFLRQSGHDDIIVPMIDYEVGDGEVWKIMRTSLKDWTHNLETIQTWSPYNTEEELFDQFTGMMDHGTRIVLYNLWEDDQGQLELDFDTDPNDIQIRGANRDEKKIQMAQRFPNSSHFLTYRYSLRSYVSILYLKLPPKFRIILRGQEVQHHSLVDDLMFTQELTYRPQSGAEHVTKETDMLAVVTIGFVKDAKDHVNIQGFNVYHKNRLIKPFWKIWNCTGSDGRGIIGVLEANFVEPAHDKQGFERTTVLSRLESRLLQMQKNYWANNCHKVGYVSKRSKKSIPPAPLSGDIIMNRGQGSTMSSPISDPYAELRLSLPTNTLSECRRGGGILRTYGEGTSGRLRLEIEPAAAVSRSGSLTNGIFVAKVNDSVPKDSRKSLEDLGRMFVRRAAAAEVSHPPQEQQRPANSNSHRASMELEILKQLKDENDQIRGRCQRLEEASEQSLMFEVDRNRKLEAQLLDLEQQQAVYRRNLEKCVRERDSLHIALEEERQIREHDDEKMRKKLKVALLRVRELESENHRLRFSRC